VNTRAATAVRAEAWTNSTRYCSLRTTWMESSTSHGNAFMRHDVHKIIMAACTNKEWPVQGDHDMLSSTCIYYIAEIKAWEAR
jgi:tRNA U38,U39,U40 pseudouridine synthase TruA